jgi:hypothetical protein
MLAYCRAGAGTDGDNSPKYPFDEHVYTAQFQRWLGSSIWCVEESSEVTAKVHPKTVLENSEVSAVHDHVTYPAIGLDNGLVQIPNSGPVGVIVESHSCMQAPRDVEANQDVDYDDCDECFSALPQNASNQLLQHDHQPWCRETAAMHVEDLAAWWLRERTSRSSQHQPEPQHQAREQPPEQDSRGRVILKASLTCLDNGVESLDYQDLELHLFEREADTARHFLEELNSLKPQRVRQYLGPLTSWLREQVQSAGNEIAGSAIQVVGDLEEMRRKSECLCQNI